MHLMRGFGCLRVCGVAATAVGNRCGCRNVRAAAKGAIAGMGDIGWLRAYCLPRCDVARRLAPYYVWEQLGWRHGLETHHGCCMEPLQSRCRRLRFHEPVLRFLKTRRLTAAGECLCGRHEGCCAFFRASVGPKVQKNSKKHSQIARPLGRTPAK